MSTLLRVDGSFRTEGSITRAVADSAQAAWLAEHPEGTVVKRDLGVSPLPADAWGLATAGKFTPEEQRTQEQTSALALAAVLADEIINADALIVGSPLYNYGVSEYLKVWIDLLIADPRLGPGSTELTGKPALLIVAQGGSYAEGSPRHGWDYATPYLTRILADNFGMELSTVVSEFTLAPVNPALSEFVGVAEQSLATAHAEAASHGTSIAARLKAAA